VSEGWPEEFGDFAESSRAGLDITHRGAVILFGHEQLEGPALLAEDGGGGVA
jgi:hypothetical protein